MLQDLFRLYEDLIVSGGFAVVDQYKNIFDLEKDDPIDMDEWNMNAIRHYIVPFFEEIKSLDIDEISEEAEERLEVIQELFFSGKESLKNKVKKIKESFEE